MVFEICEQRPRLVCSCRGVAVWFGPWFVRVVMSLRSHVEDLARREAIFTRKAILELYYCAVGCHMAICPHERHLLGLAVSLLLEVLPVRVDDIDLCGVRRFTVFLYNVVGDQPRLRR